MKRGILIVLMAFLGLTSVMAAQKVTLKCREVALKEIFARITKQTGLTVAYSSQVLNVDTKISIETENAEITEVLEKLLPATIGYKIENSSILIFKKEVSKKASTVRMKGIVFDKKTRERLAGVTLVLNDNPSVGTITDIDGVFQITAAQGSKLKVSYIGYETQLVAISPVDELKVELDQDNFKLDEVVVTGQGAEVQKRRLSSNVTTGTYETGAYRPGVAKCSPQCADNDVQWPGRCNFIGKVKRSIFCFL